MNKKQLDIIGILVAKKRQKLINLLLIRPNLTESEIKKILHLQSRIFFYHKKEMKKFGLLEDVLVYTPSKNKNKYRSRFKDSIWIGNRLTKKALRILKQLEAIKT